MTRSANIIKHVKECTCVQGYLGLCIKNVLGSNTTRYVYSGSKPIAEYVGTTNPTLSTEYIYAGSQLLATIAGSATTYHHPDHLSNRAETNSSGTRTRTFGQLPFGETWYETGTVDKWKFTGYEHDSGTGETGLDYANFRYYASAQGRFMSADFLGGHPGAPQSLNRYAYATNDPLNRVDPLGLDDDTLQNLSPCIPPRPDCIRVTTSWWQPIFVCPSGAYCWAPGPWDEFVVYGGGPIPNLFSGPGVAPQPGPFVRRMLQVQQVIDRILNALNDCSDFFNNSALVGAFGAAGVYDNLNIQIQDNSTATGTYTSQAARSEQASASESPTTVLVWTNCPLGVPMQPANFGGNAGPPALLHIGSFLGGTLGADVIMMLHELAHIVDVIPRDGPSVDPTGKVSQQNTDTILKNCEDALKDVMSGLEP